MMDVRALVANAGPNDLPFEDPALPGHEMVLRSARPRRFSTRTPVLSAALH
jgi:hypothetical protein